MAPGKTTFARMRTEDQMEIQSRQRGPSGAMRGIFRSMAEAFAGMIWNEPIAVVTKLQFNRLCQLERREELRMAERHGDDAFLERELARVQFTANELGKLGGKITPIAQWPEENFEEIFDDRPESK
jgi:hypothetical protein